MARPAFILNPRDIRRFMDVITKDVLEQIPFGYALALSRTARDIQDVVKAELPRIFTIRTRWVPNSIKTERAEKKHWPLTRARVGTISPFMPLHITGGDRTPKGSGQMGVPVAARKTKRATTRPSKWPSRVLEKRGYYRLTRRGKSDLIFHRKRKGAPPRLFWVLTNKVRVEKRWDFEEQAIMVAKQVWRRNYQRAMKRAMETAKRKARRRRR